MTFNLDYKEISSFSLLVDNPEQKLLTNLTEHNTKFQDVISIRKNFYLEFVNKLKYIMTATKPTFEELFIDDSSNVYTHELYIFIKNILYPKILDFSRLVPSVDRISIILSICDDKYPLSIINYIIKYPNTLFYTEYEIINNYTELTRFLLLNGYKPQLEAAGRYYLENIQNLFPFIP